MPINPSVFDRWYDHACPEVFGGLVDLSGIVT
jgi:hypothetical protein